MLLECPVLRVSLVIMAELVTLDRQVSLVHQVPKDKRVNKVAKGLLVLLDNLDPKVPPETADFRDFLALSELLVHADCEDQP